jgi:DHA1 family tetracycline resistance protein-like MFS transporter
LPFFVAGGLAVINWLYGYFVLPESLPPHRRQPFKWRTANPISSLHELGALKGVGLLVLVLALTGLAQYMTHSTWVLYTTFKFGWGPRDNGWSLFAIGVMSALVQGVLLKPLLKRFSPQRLALMGLLSSSLCYLLWGAASQGWMLYPVILANVFGFTVTASLQSIVSNAAEPSTQGRTMGAVASLNSMMAVLAPMIGGPLLVMVSHLPKGDWRLGAPYYFCALLQAAAMFVALHHFKSERRRRMAAIASAQPLT